MLLILTSLATLVTDGPLVHGLVGIAAAVALASAALAVRPMEGAHLMKAVRWLLVAMAIVALAILLQLIPIPIAYLVHPMWLSAREAVNQTFLGYMSIDLGDTLMALGRYLSVMAIVLTAAIVTLDRQRAEWILSLLASVATVGALLLIFDRFAGSNLISSFNSSEAQASCAALASLGVTLTATAVDRAVERYETRRLTGQISWRVFLQMLGVSLFGFVICAITVDFFAPPPVCFAAAFGIATLLIIIFIRRLGLGRWAAIIALVGAVIVAVVVATTTHNTSSTEPTLRFSSDSAQAQVSLAERMIADNWRGSGAGTFSALLPAYADTDDQKPSFTPTFAAEASIEMGRPGLVMGALLALAVIGLLLRGAFERGRDSFYSAGATGCCVTLLIEAFTDFSLLTTSVAIVAAAIVGMGFAQRLSRTLQ
jgi:hypothetical protein